LTFYGFDADYLQRLTQGDPYVEHHFTAYFGELLTIKLRRRLRSPQLIEDVRQETLFRVIRAIRSGTRFEHPERFGAYVNTVCDNVRHEVGRRENRQRQFTDDDWDPADDRIDLDLEIVTAERKRLIRKTLDELPARDRDVLTLLFLDEQPPDQVCERLGVDREYLRVLVHRAKIRFRSKSGEAFSAGGQGHG
jgi:RNA polymerase sigma-70 factor (ECF subfamily)